MEKVKKITKKYFKYIVLVACMCLIFVLYNEVSKKQILSMDTSIYNVISNNIISDSLTPTVVFLTNIGGTVFLIVLTLILLLTIKNKKIGLSIISNIVIITILNQLLKRILQRPRPTEFRIVEETGYSFPSGHSITSMVFYGYLVYLTYKYINNKKIKIPLIIFLILLIPTIGLSRIYLGVHYASDVLCGFLLGTIYLILFISISKKYLERK